MNIASSKKNNGSVWGFGADWKRGIWFCSSCQTQSGEKKVREIKKKLHFSFFHFFIVSLFFFFIFSIIDFKLFFQVCVKKDSACETNRSMQEVCSSGSKHFDLGMKTGWKYIYWLRIEKIDNISVGLRDKSQ